MSAAETVVPRLTKAGRAAIMSDHWHDWRPLLKVGLVYWGGNGRYDRQRLKKRPAFNTVRAAMMAGDA